MQIDSNIVGLAFEKRETRIDWRQTSNYAAAISDLNPLYLDDTNPANVAHPMFPVALSWSQINNLHKHHRFPYPKDILKTMVHYSEYIEMNRLIRPGETVFIEGEIAAVIPHKNGTQIVVKSVVTDQEGQIIHTEYIGGMLRGVECVDGGKGIEKIPLIKNGPRQNIEEEWETSLFIRPEAPFLYDGCTNIVFGIHTSPQFAQSVGLPGIILQGTATLALVVTELVNKEANGNPNKVKAISGRFTDIVFPNTNVKLQIIKSNVKKNKKEIHFRVLNDKNRQAISDGYIIIEL